MATAIPDSKIRCVRNFYRTISSKKRTVPEGTRIGGSNALQLGRCCDLSPTHPHLRLLRAQIDSTTRCAPVHKLDPRNLPDCHHLRHFASPNLLQMHQTHGSPFRPHAVQSTPRNPRNTLRRSV